jgi:hypothetical protein
MGPIELRLANLPRSSPIEFCRSLENAMSEGILERVDPRFFRDFDDRKKPLPLDLKAREWAITEHVMKAHVSFTMMGYVCPAAIVAIPHEDGSLWLFVAYRTNDKRFRAARIPDSAAAECLILCGHDLPSELRKFGTPAPNVDEAGANAPNSRVVPNQKARESLDRIPSVDQLVTVHQALWVFILRKRYESAMQKQEEEYLGFFCRLADALRPIRALLTETNGWPSRVERALPVIINLFDENARHWGWEGLAAAEPERSAYITERQAQFLDRVGRGRYEAALSWQAGCRGLESPSNIDAIADEGRKLGFSATLSPDDGKAKFKEAEIAWRNSPRLGTAYPRIGEAELEKFEKAWQALHDALQPIAPKETARAVWHEQPEAKVHSGPAAIEASASAEIDPPETTDPPQRSRGSDPTSAAPASRTGTMERSETNASARRSRRRRHHHHHHRGARERSDKTAGDGSNVRNTESNKALRDQVVISYSHQDKRFLDDLLTHIKPYLRKGKFPAWSDKQIEPGSVWFDKIKAALAKTSVAVLLVSPDFLASDFIHDNELGPLLKEAADGGVKILWVLIRDCAWRETPLKDFQSVLPPEQPLAAMTKAKRDTAWRKVCEAIKLAAEPSSPRPSALLHEIPAGRPRASSANPESREPRSRAPSNEPESAHATPGTAPMEPLKVICPLHGIRTLASWQKGLADLAQNTGWRCRLDRWSYGHFPLRAFLKPWRRESQIGWLRGQYDAEIHDRRLAIENGQTPSVVAHSFGTYILGYTLLTFDFIRFNKVILCGSILPIDFPWDKLIERGQVQAVRNEFGVRDLWVKRVQCFVRGTGPSGAAGFTCKHDRLEQEKFNYRHSQYFGLDHMEDRWIPFLNKPLAEIPRVKNGPPIPWPQTSAPWCLYGLILIVTTALAALVTGCLLMLWMLWGYLNLLQHPDRPNTVYEYVIGEKVNEAKRLLQSQGLELRVSVEDGERLFVTKDFKKNRVNVEVRDGKIERIEGSY